MIFSGRYDGEIVYTDNTSEHFVECTLEYIMKQIEAYRDNIKSFTFTSAKED